MDSESTSTTGLINRGAAAFNEGRFAEARALFARALLANPQSEAAWLWFATVADDPGEQRYALNRAMAINPESRGLHRLVLLPPGPATIPPDLVELDEPPLPPDLAAASRVALLAVPRPAVERQHRARATRSSRARSAGEEAPAAEPTTAAGGTRPPWLPWLLAALALVAIVAVVAAFMQRQQAGPDENAYVVAYAGPLSGPDSFIGEEQLRAVELAVDTLNEGGGIGGRMLNVVSYDDANDPARAAQVAAQIVANDRVLLVIGHDRSDASLAAAPIYEEAGLAAITPSSTADALTATDPWYFRSIFTNHDEGELIASYSQHALLRDRASVISTSREYESSLASAFVDRFGQGGTIVEQWTLEPDSLDASIAATVEALKAADDPGIVFLALQPSEARPLLLALGRAGVTTPMIGGEAIGYGDFVDLFEDEPEEVEQPGFFTNGLYAASPMIYDSLGGDALAFAQRFRSVYGTSPEWFGAKAYDATTLAIHAITTLHEEANPPADLNAQRQVIQESLTAINSPENAVPGLSGPLYFDAMRSMPPVLSFGQFDLGTLLSAPLQYRAVEDPDKFDLAADQAAGLLFEVNGQTYRQYRVVYVGVDINEVSNLDVQAQTFDADFFLWFRYLGDKSAENIFFANADDPEEALPEALDRTEDQGENFAIFRVNITFAEPMNFQDYPWDQHLLTIDLQNVSLSQDDLVYVPDQANIRQPQAERLRSGIDFTRPFNRIPSWIAERVFFAQDSAITRSTTPNPRTGAPEYERASTYQVQMSFARDVRSFLIKNLLPLALLALVTYISLFFSPENAGTRIGFSITAILTTSVLLQSVASNLPDIGYTVAIEWGYYVYIGLSALLVLINITIDRWYKAKRFAAVRQLDLFARILYPVVLVIVVIAFAVKFG